MTFRIHFIERRPCEFVSIEKAFRTVAAALPGEQFEYSFRQMPHESSIVGICRNLLEYRPSHEADIFHITGDVHYAALKLAGERTVLTIHDLGFLRRRSGPRGQLIRKLFLEWPMNRVKYVTTVSAATKAEIVDETGCDPDGIVVIPNPIAPVFTGASRIRPFNASCPRILIVGTSPHKNVRRIAEALRGTACRLEIVGSPDRDLREALEQTGIEYAVSAGLDEVQMREKYDSADLVVFCSTFEGFGMPIIEAQGTGTPLVTSDISPLREVAGAGACVADPFDVRAIRAAVRRVIADTAYRKAIVSKGLKNVERYSPHRVSRLYADLYGRILRANERMEGSWGEKGP